MKKRRKIKWDIVIDLIMLVVFSILTIYLSISMIIRGLSTIELILLFVFPTLANGSLCNVIEE